MTDSLIPDTTKTAAKRGFIRTAAQSLSGSAALGGGLTLVFTGDALLTLGVGLASAVAGAAVAGAQSYFSIISKGIPEEYSPVVDVTAPVGYEVPEVSDAKTEVVDILGQREGDDTIDIGDEVVTRLIQAGWRPTVADQAKHLA